MLVRVIVYGSNMHSGIRSHRSWTRFQNVLNEKEKQGDTTKKWNLVLGVQKHEENHFPSDQIFSSSWENYDPNKRHCEQSSLMWNLSYTIALFRFVLGVGILPVSVKWLFLITTHVCIFRWTSSIQFSPTHRYFSSASYLYGLKMWLWFVFIAPVCLWLKTLPPFVQLTFDQTQLRSMYVTVLLLCSVQYEIRMPFQLFIFITNDPRWSKLCGHLTIVLVCLLNIPVQIYSPLL